MEFGRTKNSQNAVECEKKGVYVLLIIVKRCVHGWHCWCRSLPSVCTNRLCHQPTKYVFSHLLARHTFTFFLANSLYTPKIIAAKNKHHEIRAYVVATVWTPFEHHSERAVSKLCVTPRNQYLGHHHIIFHPIIANLESF